MTHSDEVKALREAALTLRELERLLLGEPLPIWALIYHAEGHVNKMLREVLLSAE